MLLPGEILEHQQENVTCVGTLSSIATGNLYVTNYRLIFRGAFCHVSILKKIISYLVNSCFLSDNGSLV